MLAITSSSPSIVKSPVIKAFLRAVRDISQSLFSAPLTRLAKIRSWKKHSVTQTQTKTNSAHSALGDEELKMGSQGASSGFLCQCMLSKFLSKKFELLTMDTMGTVASTEVMKWPRILAHWLQHRYICP